MTTDSLFVVCQHHTDCWISNGTHTVHYQLPYVDAKYEVRQNRSVLCSACNDSDLREIAERHAIDISKGWYLVAHI